MAYVFGVVGSYLETSVLTFYCANRTAENVVKLLTLIPECSPGTGDSAYLISSQLIIMVSPQT